MKTHRRVTLYSALLWSLHALLIREGRRVQSALSILGREEGNDESFVVLESASSSWQVLQPDNQSLCQLQVLFLRDEHPAMLTGKQP